MGLVLVLAVTALGVTFPRPAPSPPLGAFPGPNISSPYLSVSGVVKWYYDSAFSMSTSSVCSFKTPGATTTLLVASGQVNVGSTSPFQLQISKGAFVTASTTELATMSLSSLARGTLVAVAKDAATGDENSTFAPNSWLTFKLGGVSAASANSTGISGRCKAEFIEN